MGHSSGAHLVSLLVLRRAGEAPAASAATDDDAGPATSDGVHGPRLPLRCVAAVVCLSAPFDLWRHHLFEAKRGGHVLSPMAGACGVGALDAAVFADAATDAATCQGGGARAAASAPLGAGRLHAEAAGPPAARPHQAPELAAALWRSSVLRVAQQLTPRQASEVPRLVVVHGTRDATVPWGQAAILAAALRARGCRAVDTLWLNGVDHGSFWGLVLPPVGVLDAALANSPDDAGDHRHASSGGHGGETFRLLSKLRSLAKSSSIPKQESKACPLVSKL